MPKTILGYVFKHSARQQIFVLAATLLYLPLLYVTFELPKIILNQAIGGNPADFPKVYAGVAVDQLPFLLILCVLLFALVLAAGALRYSLRTYKGVIGEMLLRRLRLDLYHLILRFPLSRLRRITGGEIIAMSTAEVEPIGRYMGIAVANPALQGGTLLTAMIFLFAQDPILGLAAIVLFPVQGYLIPVMQRKVNEASLGRIQSTRRFAAQVSETMQGLRDIRSNYTVAFEAANLSDRLAAIFARGREVYSRTSVLIFVNYFFNHLTPFLFYSIGGYLVLQGSLTLGALIAVIAAYRETAAPWNELLENYQQLQENRLKYATLVESFDIGDDPAGASAVTQHIAGDRITLKGVSLLDDGVQRLDGISMTIPIPGAVAFTGAADSGKGELAEILAGLRPPTSGRVLFGNDDIRTFTAEALGRGIAYADSQSFVFSGSWRDALIYGLKRPPEAAPDSPNGVWIDYAQAGVDGPEALDYEIRRAIDAAGLTKDVLAMGMRWVVPPDADTELKGKLLEARRHFRASLAGQSWAEAIEFFDTGRYIENATLAENLLYGRPLDDSLFVDRLGEDAEVMAVVERHGLTGRLIEIGREATRTVLELFQTIPVGDERLQRLNLISQDEAPLYQAILARHAESPPEAITGEDRRLLLAIAFQLAPAHQRLGLIDAETQAAILRAREDLMRTVAPKIADRLDPFGAERVTANITVQCNLLFGRIDRRSSHRWPDIDAQMAAAIDAAGLRERVLGFGLQGSVGTAGASLSSEQKQRLAIARGLLKRPRVFVVNEGCTALAGPEQAELIERMLAYAPQLCLFWIGPVPEGCTVFGAVVALNRGRLPGQQPGAAPAKPSPSAPGGTIESEAAVLAANPVLARIRPETLRLIAFAATRRNFESGAYILREGDKSAEVYILVEGDAEVRIGTDGHVVGTVGPGAFLGEVAALAERPRSASVIAKSEVSALSLSRDLFLDLIKGDQELSRSLLLDMAVRVTTLADEVSRAHA
jgi:ABC-type multidrug transport system fused ATPase/permease subunit